MKPNKLITMACALLLIFMLGLKANAAELSGDLTMESAGGVIEGKVHIKGNMVRHEAKHPKLGDIVTIIDASNRKAQIMMPAMKYYYDTVIPAELVGGRTLAWQGVKSLPKGAKRVGVEKVAGLQCDVYAYQDPMAGNGKAWLSKKLDFPLKIQGKAPQGKYLLELKNIKAAPQPSSLFKPPADYRRMQVDPKALELLLKIKL